MDPGLEEKGVKKKALETLLEQLGKFQYVYKIVDVMKLLLIFKSDYDTMVMYDDVCPHS